MSESQLQYTGTNGIKMAFEEILRAIFSDNTFIKDERYLYTADENTAGLKIYRRNPKRLRFYPNITISSEAYDASLTALGDNAEEGGETYDEQGVPTMSTYTGQYTVPIRLSIQAMESTDDRELLTDYVVQILRILGRDQFVQYGLGWNKIQVAGEAEEEDETGRIIYTNAVTVDVNTDYTRVVTPDDADFIEKVSIEVLGKVYPNSTPVPLHKEPPF